MESNMINFVLATDKPWHDALYDNLQNSIKGAKWFRIQNKQELTHQKLSEIQPAYIFIPHWSYIIPSEIYENFCCVVFHMTDLPYGRGGSPLQNLIVRGYKETKISAIQVQKGLDTGAVYLKKTLCLAGTAEEIFLRATTIIEEMIFEIIEKKLTPVPQVGEPVIFKRRKPEESNIAELEIIDQLYDYIRMLDCPGYPNAYLETKHFRLEFSRASLKSDESILADVRITKK